MLWRMGKTFAQKFEEALDARRLAEPGYGLRTLARALAKDDPRDTKTVLRRLQKYRPKRPGGGAEVAPTDPTRHEIESALGLKFDALRTDEDVIAALSPAKRLAEMENALRPLAALLKDFA